VDARSSRRGLNLLAAIALAACAGFFVWGAILTAGGVSSQVPHNVGRGRQQMLVSALCALAVGIGALLIRTFFQAGQAAGPLVGKRPTPRRRHRPRSP
jgi:hypothetical protein